MELTQADSKLYAEVILDTAMTSFTYEVPQGIPLQKGTRVKVSLRQHIRYGFILSLSTQKPAYPVLAILEVSDIVIPEDLFNLALWMSNYYATALSKVLKYFLLQAIRKGKEEKKENAVVASLPLEELKKIAVTLKKKAPEQKEVLELIIKKKGELLLPEILETLSISKSPIEALIHKKLLHLEKRKKEYTIPKVSYVCLVEKKLNEEQARVLDAIMSYTHQESSSVHVLYGITGSGKTEVYLQLIEHILLQKKTVLFLVPEISLTPQTMERFQSRLPYPMVLLHHRLTESQRLRAWHQIKEGQFQIVIGARSALFAPLDRLGLIIVDEEHDSSYKQQDSNPCYHARDVAIMRGVFTKAIVVLGSATPSLETFHNAMKGKYILHQLNYRVPGAKLPKINILDMKQEIVKQEGFSLFAPSVINALAQRFEQGEQSIIFLNRRGYHTSLICKQCRYVFRCHRCDIALTFHRADQVLACHLCDMKYHPLPTKCPQCHTEQMLKYQGYGTEHVEQALKRLFPKIRTLRIDRDTTRSVGSYERLFQEFRSVKADVLIGTQMVTKGLHFPHVTLVVILNPDLALSIPDFRSTETIFQHLIQASGRAGRGALSGEVFIQTFHPQLSLFKLAQEQDFAQFYQEEMQIRKKYEFPPFCRLIKIIFSGKECEYVHKYAQQFRQELIHKVSQQQTLFPVIAAGHPKVNEIYRFQFLIKTRSIASLVPHCYALLEKKTSKKVHVCIDVDPLSTFF